VTGAIGRDIAVKAHQLECFGVPPLAAFYDAGTATCEVV
jgi:hypothetical protein